MTDELQKANSDNEKLRTQLLTMELEIFREARERFEKLPLEKQEEILKEVRVHKSLKEIIEEKF